MTQPSFNDNCNIEIMMISLQIGISCFTKQSNYLWNSRVLMIIVIFTLWWFHCKMIFLDWLLNPVISLCTVHIIWKTTSLLWCRRRIGTRSPRPTPGRFRATARNGVHWRSAAVPFPDSAPWYNRQVGVSVCLRRRACQQNPNQQTAERTRHAGWPLPMLADFPSGGSEATILLGRTDLWHSLRGCSKQEGTSCSVAIALHTPSVAIIM